MQDLVELGKLCKRKKIAYVVNATQGIGAMPLDVKKANIDFLTCSGFKWLEAGYGIGILYINKKWLDAVDCPMAGWQRGVRGSKKWARDLEVGCPQFPNIFALGGALKLLNTIGKKRIQERIYELNDYLIEQLKPLQVTIVTPLDKKYRSGITIIKMDNPQKVVQRLAKQKIIVSARGEGLRVSVHIYNNKNDIDRFVSVLRIIVKKTHVSS
jgi:cysteine desulfurase / selenocysteine lyase